MTISGTTDKRTLPMQPCQQINKDALKIQKEMHQNANKIIYIYHNTNDAFQQNKFFEENNDIPMKFVAEIERNMQTVGDHLSDHKKID